MVFLGMRHGRQGLQQPFPRISCAERERGRKNLPSRRSKIRQLPEGIKKKIPSLSPREWASILHDLLGRCGLAHPCSIVSATPVIPGEAHRRSGIQDGFAGPPHPVSASRPQGARLRRERVRAFGWQARNVKKRLGRTIKRSPCRGIAIPQPRAGRPRLRETPTPHT